MKVDDVIEELTAAFPAFNSKSADVWAQAFRTRLRHHEGPALREAHVAVMAAFKPTGRQPFPLPADYDQHLPGHARVAAGAAGKSMKAELEARHSRAEWLFAGWWQNQGRKLQRALPRPVHDHCVLEAQDLARRAPEPLQELVLTQDQIDICASRALSQWRVAKFGRLPEHTEVWERQRAEIRALPEWQVSP